MFRPRLNSDRFAGLLVTVLFAAAAPVLAGATRLTPEPSAFLQAQAGSPVDWMPWGPDAFARAAKEKKPVLVAIGTFASELSRAMSRQSFANPETGKFLNEQFVCVMVDAKERADVAALYQNYLQAVKQVSGPPMNIWLTPELKPFEGANYLPPTEEWGKEGFITISKRVAAAWTADATAQARKAEEAVETVKAALPHAPAPAIAAAELAKVLSEATETWKARFDTTNGGFGEPPKYAEPELLRFFLRTPATQSMALSTLRAIIHSPMHDPLDGGFFRYGSDAAWKQPYFQKIMSDQPRLALALMDAARVSGEPEFAAAARGALQFVLQRLALPGGEYVAVEDATGEELTGSYLWSFDELRTALGDKDAAEFARNYGATAEGNLTEDAFPGLAVKGRNLLFRATPPGDAATEAALARSAAKLLQQRALRPPPRRDDGATSGAHGLMLTALARAGAELKDSQLAAAAKAEAGFIQQHLRSKEGGLQRISGRAFVASPADYGLVAEGALTLAEVTGEAGLRELAQALISAANQRYWDASAQRFFALPEVKDPAFWLRVYSPAASAGDLPTAEPAMLIALRGQKAAPDRTLEQARQIVATLAADAKAAADPVRGDVLLALQTAQANLP